VLSASIGVLVAGVACGGGSAPAPAPAPGSPAPAKPGLPQAPDTLSKIRQTGSITLGNGDSSIPFVYYDDKHQPVGYTLELCYRIVDAIKAELGMSKIDIVYHPVNSATRIPLVVSGAVDLECGSTTHTAKRQEQVDFAITHFVASSRFVAPRSANLRTLDDLRGKTVISTTGTTAMTTATALNTEHQLGMTILGAKLHTEAFEAVATGQAAAFFMDDILLYGLVANAKDPSEWMISEQPLTTEPYAIMMRKGDVALKMIVDGAIRALYHSGEIREIYRRWFLQPTPPRGINLAVPMSAALEKVVARPIDSADPRDYQ
jgi:glutamate/aspartate transport system substrate-binding protein